MMCSFQELTDENGCDVMYKPFLRIFLIAFALISGMYLIVINEIVLGLFIIAASLLLSYGFLKYHE